jgi:predicted RNase H-like HicB family nuclease
MKFIYPAIIHEDIDGYWAEFIDLVGCSTQGDTLEELLENANEALEVYLLGLLEDGIKLPTPSSITNQKHLEENCFATLITTEFN